MSITEEQLETEAKEKKQQLNQVRDAVNKIKTKKLEARRKIELHLDEKSLMAQFNSLEC